MTATTLTPTRQSTRPPVTFSELLGRTLALTGPERLEAFEALTASVQAAMWRNLARRVEAER